MAPTQGILQAVLVKVVPGTEHDVRAWLLTKANRDKGARHCLKGPVSGQRCKLCSDEELQKPALRDKGLALPCEEMEVVAIAYLTGPFDFLLVARVPDCATVETFLVDCLRCWEASSWISDTQTLTGVIHFCVDGSADR